MIRQAARRISRRCKSSLTRLWREIRLLDLAASPVFGAYFWGGILALLVEPPTIVEEQLGPVLGVCWAAALILGPLMAVLSFPRPDEYASIWFRISSGLFIFGGIGTFAMCALHAFGWQSFVVSVTVGLSGAALLALGIDILKMIRCHREAKG